MDCTESKKFLRKDITKGIDLDEIPSGHDIGDKGLDIGIRGAGVKFDKGTL